MLQGRGAGFGTCGERGGVRAAGLPLGQASVVVVVGVEGARGVQLDDAREECEMPDFETEFSWKGVEEREGGRWGRV